jgi:hypothetical protein
MSNALDTACSEHTLSWLKNPTSHVQLASLIAPAYGVSEWGGQLTDDVTENGAKVSHTLVWFVWLHAGHWQATFKSRHRDTAKRIFIQKHFNLYSTTAL